MLALLFKIVRQLFLKVLKSAHRLTLTGKVLNKVANKSWKVPLTSATSLFNSFCINVAKQVARSVFVARLT